MVSESSRSRGLHMVDASEQDTFKKHRFHAYYIWVVLHEIFGHGTGRFLTESSDGGLNFDIGNPPLDPFTGKPVESWYRAGQTWTGVFNDLATTVDECRAELVGAYLVDDLEILSIFGYTGQSEVKPDDSESPCRSQKTKAHSVTYSRLQHVSSAGRRWTSRP